MKNIYLVLLLFPKVLFCQIGFIDNEFISGSGTELSIDVLSSAVQNDGKIIIGGAFLRYNGVEVKRILRLMPNGLIDYSLSPNNGPDAEILDIKLKDDKIIIGGFFSTYNNQEAKGICKLNLDGTIDDSFNSFANSNSGIYTIELDDDKLFIGGNIPYYNGVNVNNIALLNANGAIDNSFNSGTGFNDKVLIIKKQIDGKILVGGSFTSYNGVETNRITRLNMDGSIDNSFNIGSAANDEIRSIQVQDDGKILLFGKFTSFNGQLINRSVRLNSDGTIDESFLVSTGSNNWILCSKLLDDGSIIIGGNFTSYNGVFRGRIAKLDSNGNLIESFILNNGFNNIVNSINFTPENKLIVTGSFSEFDGFPHKGIISINHSYKGVFGKFYKEIDIDCVQSSQEEMYANAIFTISPGNLIVTTNNQGYFLIDDLPNGNYQIIFDTTQLWRVSCLENTFFSILNPDTITEVSSIGMEYFYQCQKPKISIYMPFMRPCFEDQQIFVEACNEIDATDVLPFAFSIIELDSNLIFENASIPFTSLGNYKYRFDHGTLFPGECVNFTVFAQVSCDAVLGQTICLKADLYPIADCVLDIIPALSTGEVLPCTLPWDQSNLTVRSWCANDSIYFMVSNTGTMGLGDMQCYSPVRVFVDGVLTQLDSILLQGGETFTYTFAGTGQTWIMQIDQHPLHLGNSNPSAHVENCGSGTWTPDLINDLPLDDADPVVDIYCGIVTGSYDPNDKRGFPNGISDEHFIAKNQELEYIIRFQNTGTDTAFTVVVRDTLDENFNIFTVTPGVSSHNYSFRMYGPRVLEWTFANILLPDSTTNEPLSNGFLTFTVKQNPNLAEGTVLSNDADIYFDFNEPIITNETTHKISYQINTLSTLQKFKTQKSVLKLYPNPSNSTFTIDLNTFSKNVNYKIYSLSGTLLQEKENSYGQKILVDVKNLENGLYFIELEYDNRIEVLNFVRN